METLSHPRDSKLSAFVPLVAIVLVYVMVAAAMIGNILQHAHRAEPVAQANAVQLIKA